MSKDQVAGGAKLQLLAFTRPNKFVDLDRVITTCVQIVYEQLPRETTHVYRVSPLALTRLAQGGKTTTLGGVFDKLKKDGKVNPVGISLDAQRTKLRDGETQNFKINCHAA